MKKICQNNKGLTLVELIVSVALLGIFCVCCAFLIRPCAEAFTRIQQQTRAQHIADTIVEDLRSELLNASGTIRFTDAATETAKFAPFTKPTGDFPLTGTALEICPADGYYEVIDAGYVPETVKKKTNTNPAQYETIVSAEKAKTTQGYLHMRYYMLELPDGATAPCYTWQTDTGSGLAFAYADAYPEKFYMKDKVTLKFGVQSYNTGVASGLYMVNRATALKVTVCVYGEGVDPYAADAVPVHTQDAILELPNAPIMVQMPEQYMPKNP